MRVMYIVSILLLCSCTQQRLVKRVAQFMGQQIYMPTDLNAFYKGKDTLLPDFTKAPIKLVVWFDSQGCTSCDASKMFSWGDIANHADSLSQWFNIIFLFTPKKEDNSALTMALTREHFDYPVFIDSKGSFVKQNPKLPKNRNLHSFLLDKNNRVVMVGNPLYNSTLWELYKRTIQRMIDNGGVLPE